MQNILLVNPKPYFFEPSSTVPLGLAYIAATLEKSGHNVTVQDLAVQEDNVLGVLKKHNIDAVGITANTSMITEAWEIASRVKEFNKNIITILGGPHPSALPSESLARPQVDIVVRGEGEQTVRELFHVLEHGGSLRSINGISHKENGKIKHNVPRDYTKDLDSLPFPAYHLFPPLDQYAGLNRLLSKRKRTACIITSRGCPFNCVWCFKGIFEREYRVRSPENVLEEWRMLVEDYEVREIGIQDDQFNLLKERVFKICRLIKREGLDTPWITANGIRVDYVDKKLLRAMKESGCYRIWYGVESGSQRVLDESIGKRITLDQVRRAVRITKDVGIEVGAFFVLGNPGETREEMEKTIQFAIELNPDFCQFNIATPFPGTRLWKILENEGKFLFTDWYLNKTLLKNRYYHGRAFYEYGETKKEVVEEMYKKAYRKFYLRPSFFMKLATRKETYLNVFNTLRGAIQFLK